MATFSRAEHPGPYGEADVRLASDLASRTAVHVDNARLYTRKHTTAVTPCKRSLLPRRVSQVAGLQIAYRYEPASQTAEVGGDGFDVIPLKDGKAALVVGDVTGHSIHAAAIMGHLRATTAPRLASAAPRRDHGPAQPGGRRARRGGRRPPGCTPNTTSPPGTAASPAPGTCRPPPPRRHGGPHRRPERGDARRRPSRYPATDIDLPPGSVLALYTDGLVEHPGRDITAGMSRLARTLAADPARSLDQVCDSLLAGAGACARDDIALLLARTATETAR